MNYTKFIETMVNVNNAFETHSNAQYKPKSKIKFIFIATFSKYHINEKFLPKLQFSEKKE